jgi:hypothetical protein
MHDHIMHVHAALVAHFRTADAEAGDEDAAAAGV